MLHRFLSFYIGKIAYICSRGRKRFVSYIIVLPGFFMKRNTSRYRALN